MKDSQLCGDTSFNKIPGVLKKILTENQSKHLIQKITEKRFVR